MLTNWLPCPGKWSQAFEAGQERALRPQAAQLQGTPRLLPTLPSCPIGLGYEGCKDGSAELGGPGNHGWGQPCLYLAV